MGKNKFIEIRIRKKTLKTFFFLNPEFLHSEQS